MVLKLKLVASTKSMEIACPVKVFCYTQKRGFRSAVHIQRIGTPKASSLSLVALKPKNLPLDFLVRKGQKVKGGTTRCDDSSREYRTAYPDIQEETLHLLEWYSVTRQVKRFCSTPLTISKELKIGSSIQESEILLQQSEAALSLVENISFQGINDTSYVLASSSHVDVIAIEDICLVGKLLKASRSLVDQLNLQRQKVMPLLELFQGADFCVDLSEDIERCLDGSFKRVLDSASDKLSEIRKSCQANDDAILALLKATSRELMKIKAVDGPQVVQRRGRFCIGVKAGFKSRLQGGITLDVSNSGATHFVEPEAAIPLNNRRAELAGEEYEEVRRILKELTLAVSKKKHQIRDLQDRITRLDFAVARSRYAKWMKAVKPTLIACEDLRGKKVLLKQVSHPLLLEAYIDCEDEGKPNIVAPVPVDFEIGTSIKVVAVTGPNTGGKTVAIKTLGISALMAKAGIFLPATEATLPWFDTILADIGDEQSLEQSLSTFSGHIKRLVRILETAGNHSLVLLDEVGSGTDPTEGAALASSILRHLSNLAQLTVATTHYAELNTLKSEDSRFENVCMEFDIQTLRPTYRLLWGQSGQSNAFAIAEARNFDHDIVKKARELAKQLKPADSEARANELIGSLVKQEKDFSELALQAKLKREKLEKELRQMRKEYGDINAKEECLKQEALQEMTAEVVKSKKYFNEEVKLFESALGLNQEEKLVVLQPISKEKLNKLYEQAANKIREVDRSFKVSSFDVFSSEEELSDNSESDGSLGTAVKKIQKQWTPQVGDQVTVRRLGKAPVEIVRSVKEREEYVVQFGKMRVNVKMEEMLPPNIY